jgi:hypothetical protein
MLKWEGNESHEPERERRRLRFIVTEPSGDVHTFVAIADGETLEWLWSELAQFNIVETGPL